mmetsp:Transcript_290/g.570  ORF Transcript_290/g.570 Transcript_290/m.570 type:complete len:537 (+) Transcript_290:1-1611(+)
MMPVSIGGSAMVPMPSGELTTAPVVAGGPASVAMESVDRAAPVPADRFSASPCATQDSKNPLAADKIAEKPFVVTVVAPGAGVDVNSASYESLKKTSDHRSYGAIEVRFKGHKGAAYDVYPSSWPHGRAAPNLQSFAESLAEAGDLSSSSCLIFGSRGGQVVLPALWRAFGSSLPPALVINGGCAMSMLPDRGWWHWPDGAISFLLMGGKDYFRGKFSNEQHLRDAMGSVPKCNSTTAILYIDQMSHTPHGSLFMPLLGPLVHSLFEWKDSGCAPVSTFRHIINIARAGGFTGRLTFKEEPGDKWDETSFASFGVSRSVARVPARLRAFVARENQMLAPPPTTRPALHIEGTKSATGPAPAAATGTRSITSQAGGKLQLPPRMNTAYLAPTLGLKGSVTPPCFGSSTDTRCFSPTLLTSCPPASLAAPVGRNGGGGYVRIRPPPVAPSSHTSPAFVSAPIATAGARTPMPDVPKLTLNGVTLSPSQLAPTAPLVAPATQPPVPAALVAELEQFNARFFANPSKFCPQQLPQWQSLV